MLAVNARESTISALKFLGQLDKILYEEMLQYIKYELLVLSQHEI